MNENDQGAFKKKALFRVTDRPKRFFTPTFTFLPYNRVGAMLYVVEGFFGSRSFVRKIKLVGSENIASKSVY